MIQKRYIKILAMLTLVLVIQSLTPRMVDATPPFPARGRLYIADSLEKEFLPAVAYCSHDGSGKYLTTYILNDNVYGQYLYENGTLVNSLFQISESGFPADYLDVTCIEGMQDLYIVTWSGRDSSPPFDSDIYAKVLYPGLDIQDQIYIAATGIYEFDPAIACNTTDMNCLITYSVTGVGSGDIRAQRITVSPDGISLSGDMFQPTSAGGTQQSTDLAWNDLTGTFMIVWEEDSSYSGNPYSIRFAIAWDHDKGSYDEMLTTPAWLVTPEDFSYDRTDPVIAINSYDRNFLIAFVYDYYGDYSDLDINARRVDSGGSIVSEPFAVMQTSKLENQPAIAFSAGFDLAAGPSNQFMIAARRGSSSTASGEIFLQAVKDDLYNGSTQLEGSGLLVDATSSGADALRPALTGSSYQHRYLLAWNHEYSNSDMDVLGYLLAPYGAYLPMINK